MTTKQDKFCFTCTYRREFDVPNLSPGQVSFSEDNDNCISSLHISYKCSLSYRVITLNSSLEVQEKPSGTIPR